MGRPVDRHCFSCGKTFKKPSDFNRHKNRKTPCVIEKIPDNDTVAHRCHFCNKPYKYQRSLKNHYNTCKIKNGEKHILFEKLQHEKDIEIQLLKQENVILKQQNQMNLMADEIKKLKLTVENKQQNINNHKQHAIIQGNHNNNTQVQITLNSYKTPDMANIKLTIEDLLKDSTILKTLMESIYFNPAKPENHSILSHNLKEKKIAVYDDTWKLLTSDRERDKLVDEVTAICSHKGGALLNSDGGPYGGDITNHSLAPVIKNRIIAFNGMDKDEAQMTTGEMLNTFHSNKKMVKATIANKMIK
jgi:hypothetical protein